MVWKKEQVNPDLVKGKWTQTVWEVSDAPRYQGYSEWVNMDGKTFWLNTADAPLPGREYSVRSDYNILRRTDRLVLNDSGYTCRYSRLTIHDSRYRLLPLNFLNFADFLDRL